MWVSSVLTVERKQRRVDNPEPSRLLQQKENMWFFSSWSRDFLTGVLITYVITEYSVMSPSAVTGRDFVLVLLSNKPRVREKSLRTPTTLTWRIQN